MCTLKSNISTDRMAAQYPRGGNRAGCCGSRLVRLFAAEELGVRGRSDGSDVGRAGDVGTGWRR